MDRKLTILLEAKDLASKGVDALRVAWSRLTGAQQTAAQSAAKAVGSMVDADARAIASSDNLRKAKRELSNQLLKSGMDLKDVARKILALEDAYHRGRKAGLDHAAAVARARNEISKVAPATEQATASQRRLAHSHEQVARSSNRAGLATRVLRRAYSQLVGTIFIFFSVYRGIQLVKDSVRTYLDAAASAEGLKEKITALSDAWFQFKAQLGAAIVEMVGAQSQTSTLTQAIQTGAEWIGVHRDQIAAWGRLVGTVLKIVGSQIRLVFDLNVGLMRVIGATLTGIVLETSKAIAKAVNVGIDAINFLLGQYNSLPRVMRGPTVPGIPDFEAIDQVAGMAVEWNKIAAEIGKGVDQLAEFDDNLVSIGRHVVSLKGDLAAIRKAGERPFDPFARPTDGAGAGAGTEREEVQDFRRAEARRERAAGRALGPLQRRRMVMRGHEGLSGFGPVSGTEMSPLDGLDRISVPELPDATEGFRDGLTDAEAGIGAFFSAWQSGIAAFVEGSASLGEAFGGAITAGVAAAAGSRASFEMAEGVAALAKGIMGGPLGAGAFASAAEHFKAAAMFGVLAGAAGGLGSAIGGGGRGGGGRGGRGGEIGRQHENGFGAASQGTTTIQLVGEGLNFRDPRQVRAFADMMAKASGNRVLVVGAGGRMSTIGTNAAAAARLPRGSGVHVWNS